MMDGMVREQAPAPSLEVRGGMLCDEPGLGKTITVLALLLRTRGLLPGEDSAAMEARTCAIVAGRGGLGKG